MSVGGFLCTPACELTHVCWVVYYIFIADFLSCGNARPPPPLPPLLVLLPLPLLLLLPLLLPLPLEYAVHCERFPGFPDLSVTLTLSCL